MWKSYFSVHVVVSESSKPIQLPNVTREKHGGSAKIEVQPSNHFQEIDDRTIIIEPVIAADTSSADMKQCSNEAAYNKVLFGNKLFCC